MLVLKSNVFEVVVLVNGVLGEVVLGNGKGSTSTPKAS